MSLEQAIKQSFIDSTTLLNSFMSDPNNLILIANISRRTKEIFENGGKLIICGNGGSNCDAMHFAEEFTGRFRKHRKALPVISLSDSAHITCVGNDYGFDHVFSRGVEAFGKNEDMFIGLSTSGDSQNIINAHKTATSLGMTTLVLLGRSGGILKNKSDFEFVIPGITSDRIQEIHMIILHIIIEGVERLMFPDLYNTSCTSK